jgi:glutathione-regulated potassium-efflux system ancillary protein KefC
MREALIFLASAVICVPIAARLGLGSVLGYLIAGIAVGPWGFGLVGDVESTQNLAELGVVLMLFVIGLELEPRRLGAMKRTVFGGGSLQLAVSGIVLGGAMLAIGLPWQAALVGGLSLALSSTAIATQAMTERNMLETPPGQATFGILLFQNIAAIPLIALVPILGGVEKAGANPAWMRIGMAVAAIAGIVVVGRFLIRPALRLIARTDLRELFTAFTLLLVLGIAEVMSLAGLSMALGAFLAGVLLASSEFRHALESDIEPFKGLLLGLFFISVGMTIDFGLLASSAWLVAVVRDGGGSSRSRSPRSGPSRGCSTCVASAGCSRSCSRRAVSSPSSCSALHASHASSPPSGRRSSPSPSRSRWRRHRSSSSCTTGSSRAGHANSASPTRPPPMAR